VNKKYKVFLYVIAPILIGFFIYILFRPDKIIIFNWLDALGFSELISNLRGISPSNSKIPSWIIYNLPDGLWVYSLTALMLIIWQDTKDNKKYFWFFSPLIISIMIEIGQYALIVPGTYDYMDIILCLIATPLPFLMLYKKNN
tara:strand:- start:2 stop:430 length:429 start_codon:yes stop_codon:yes gene_type:complete